MSFVEIIELTGLGIFQNSVTQICELISNKDFPEVLGTDPDSLNDDGWKLTLELIAFSIHLADRITINIPDFKGRSLFMDALLDNVITNLSSSILEDDSPEKTISFQRQFLNLVNERSKFYSFL
jgi:hypothetical protein